MQYDEILKQIGEFGFYQKRTFSILILQPITSGLMVLASIFTMATPNHRCAIPGLENDTYHTQNDYHGYLINTSIPESSSCYLRNTSVDEYGNMTLVKYKCSSWVYDTSIYSSTLVTQFDMVCDNTVYKSNAVMAMFLGLLVGYGFLGFAADILGRKPCMVLSNYVFVTSCFILAWTPNYIVLLAARFTQGLGISGQAMTIYVIGLELVGPSKRRYTGTLSFFTWCLGLFVIALLAYLIRDWRYLQLATSILSSYMLLFVIFIPESPRWLLTKGHVEKAKEHILKIAKTNKRTISENLIDNVKFNDTDRKLKFWKLCASPKLTARTLVIYFMWFTCSIVYFGVMLNLDSLVGNVYLNLCLFTLLEIVSYTAIITLVEKIGRKKLMCGCLMLSLTSLICVVFILLYAPSDLKWLMTLFTLLGQGGINASFGIAWLWTGEINPTELRNVGLGTSSAAARIGSVSAPYLVHLRDLFEGRFQEASPYFLYCSVCLFAIILIFAFLPETSHKRLPDTIVESEKLDISLNSEEDVDITKEQEAAMLENKC